MRNALFVIAVLLVAALAAGCGGRGAEQPPQPAAQSPAPAASPAAPGASPAAPAGEGTEITIVGKDNLFEPATVTIKAGQEYTFEFKNEGTTVHNLIVQAQDAGGDFASDVAVNAGQESKFKVKIDKEGTYKMICTYHPEMVGEVKVTR
ncbi:MAG: cupredoxin domain-containing protein [Armatimonadota bacterium]|nr:cupredoxin domain-containing protein [Armatimonadota bacterium]